MDEIDTRAITQGVVAPGSPIHIEKLVLAIPRIVFEFQFHQSVVVDLAQKTLREVLDEGVLDRLHKRTRAPEFRWVLSNSTNDHTADCLPFLEESAIRKLTIPAARDKVLNHHFAGSDKS